MTETTSAVTRPAAVLQLQLAEIVFMAFARSQAVAAAARLELADHLAHGALPLVDLAQRTGTQAENLFRLLRALETIGIFTQVSSRVFANTPLSEVLRRRVPGSMWAFAVASSTSIGEMDAWKGLVSNIQTEKTAFNQIYGCPFWEYLNRKPQEAAIFNESMSSLHFLTTPAITAAYDWGRFPLIADIGGGIGSQLVDILNAHPGCRGLLFDSPGALKDAIPHDRMTCVGGSFFESVPPGPDIYILRSVVHDWCDEDAARILKVVRAAAKPGATVILVEDIVPETSEPAPSKWVDLHMMVVVGGKERTSPEIRTLLDEAGLDLKQIVPTEAGPSLIISHPRD